MSRDVAVGVRPHMTGVGRPEGPARGFEHWTHPADRRPRPGLSPIALLDLAQKFASQVPAGERPGAGALTERAYELLSLDDDFEIWSIHWPAGDQLQLHDHGGSAGAFWVVRGTLVERHYRPERPLSPFGRRWHGESSGLGFGARYVHDVVNGGPGLASSVHAYSPPMPAMTYYRASGRDLVAERTDYRTDPSWAP
jgi:hypothetical protein